MSIRYNDGVEVETKILHLLQQQQNLSSQSSICSEQYQDWPVRYHLCTERANLLRHLNFTGLDVLELGAGMGAVSRHLAENCQFLTVVEGTERRYAALSARLRDLKNWTGQVGNVQDAHFDQKFDVVCVIGVLEYSEMFINPPSDSNETPFSWFIKKASSHLKENGVLILAIENKLGIKYWSGAAEDHSGQIFDGICDYPLSPSPKTFSRKELRSILVREGFSQIDEHYPFPDYKIPSTIISEKLMQCHPDLACDLANTKSFENYGSPRLTQYPDLLALRSVSKAGLLSEFSNSFLFIATQDSDSPIRNQLLKGELKNQEVAWHYSNSRQIPTQTVFLFNSQSGLEAPLQNQAPPQIDVVKKALYPLHSLHSVGVENGFQKKLYQGKNLKLKWQTLPMTSLANGQKVENLLLSRIYFEEWTLFIDEFKQFLTWSMNLWSWTETSRSGELKGEAIDATFVNASKTNSGDNYALFDLEWSLDSSVSKSWFIFRNVFLLLRMLNLFPHSKPFPTLKALYEKLCQELEIQPEFEKNITLEAEFLSLATCAGTLEDHQRDLLSLFSHPLAIPDFPRLPQEENGLKANYLALKARNQDLEIRVGHSELLLRSRHHRLAERINQFLLKFQLIHRLLKYCLRKVS